ncbi:hypothetical protein BC351_10390 [Paenibacillus ferrarius]|uniref:Uncharacterized protein n=1 Tax=Paenibacillus ferrarius TaxID=1469647 RepID=A0A1V4H8W8_9BACL|nr:hypothetical protein [Paenibacillus ferrarius]OPH47591.1 hypothetical protein BC351_10390 [Paenibacillus ferrarius]
MKKYRIQQLISTNPDVWKLYKPNGKVIESDDLEVLKQICTDVGMKKRIIETSTFTVAHKCDRIGV